MARETSTVRVDSEDVQGEGSYVLLRRPNWKAMREALAVFQAAGGDANEEYAGLMMIDALLPGMIVEWNWTDEDGEALPLPSTDRTVLDDLEPIEGLLLVSRAKELINLTPKKKSATPR